MRAKLGDLVRIKIGMNRHVIGIVVEVGVDHRRMYGDGIETITYAVVQWFSEKYGSELRRFSGDFLEVVSEA